jgi:DNA-binding NarL/FixJ family response regulator
LDDIARNRLDFAEPYALVSASTAAAGMRRWSDAHAYVDRALAAARSERNSFAEQACYAARVRSLAHQGKQRSALSIEVPPLDGAIASIRGEVLAVRGLVLATVGRVDEACALIVGVRETTAAVETTVLCAAIGAVVALKRRDADAVERVKEFEVTAFESGALDLLVMAYRACPELLARLVRVSSDATRLSGLISRVGDGDLVAALGHHMPDDRTVRLTPREREVHALLREGLSNREIAATLVISEATAKLHTHHVLEKTGMRSRTEILVQAALERADQATSAMGENAGAEASS